MEGLSQTMAEAKEGKMRGENTDVEDEVMGLL